MDDGGGGANGAAPTTVLLHLLPSEEPKGLGGGSAREDGGVSSADKGRKQGPVLADVPRGHMGCHKEMEGKAGTPLIPTDRGYISGYG